MNQVLKDSETLLDLFEHDGWKLFQEEIQNQFTVLKDNTYLECNTNDEYQVRRGILDTFNQILAYETTIKAVHESLVEADDDSQNI